MWCIPEITPEFRRLMYNILDLYQEEYNPKRPLLGLDEKLKQLIGDVRKPIPMKPGSPEKYDYEYKRYETANIFVAVEPKGGKRFTQVTGQRTKKDFAKFVKRLVDKGYPDAKKIRLICDNLNTHNKSSLYENFEKREAERILSKIEFNYTPKHAGWLNVAEIEIGIMDKQCTDRRIKDKKTLSEEVRVWTNRRNKQKKKIDWRFTKEKADEKLGEHYVQ